MPEPIVSSNQGFRERRVTERRQRRVPGSFNRVRRHQRRWLDRVAEAPLVGSGQPEPKQVRVTTVEGMIATIFKAWEEVVAETAEGTYCRIGNRLYRQLGGAADPNPNHVQVAYEAIYREFPELRGMCRESCGEILVSTGSN